MKRLKSSLPYLGALAVFAVIGASMGITGLGVAWLWKHGDYYALGIGAGAGVAVGAIALVAANLMYLSLQRSCEAMVEVLAGEPDATQ